MNLRNRIKEQKLIFASILLALLLNFPFLSIANYSVLVAGIPILYVFVFIIWLLFILFIAFYLYFERKNHPKNRTEE